MSDDWKDQLSKATGHQRYEAKSNGGAPGHQTIFFFKDESKETIKEELLETNAKKWALAFINPSQPKDRRMQNPKLTSAQLRRFHNDVREIEAKVEAAYYTGGSNGFDRLLPFIKMIKSKVAYACPSNGRERKIPVEFREFMETMINSISDFKDFKAFSLCFEAVVGYFYGEGGR